MNHFTLIALLSLVPLTARADVLLETTGETTQSVNSATGGSFSEVDLPGFNTSLGTLTGASIAVTANVASTVIDFTGILEPLTIVDAKVGLGFLSATPIGFATQTIPVITNGVQARVDADFSATFTPGSLASFLTNGDNFFIPSPDIFIQALAGPDTEQITTIGFDITETLTYTPVPEPASIALFAGALAIFGWLAMPLRQRFA